MKRKNLASLFALATVLVSVNMSSYRPALGQAADPFVIVANKNNGAVSAMSKVTARKLLLGEVATWPNGGNVIVVLKAVGSSERAVVLSKVCGMSEAEFTRHNLQAMFMNQPVAAVQQEASAAAVKSFVKSNPGAVGFLHRSEADESVRVIWTLE
jgi:ABC-type phosphate transport system substrate-binding protein